MIERLINKYTFILFALILLHIITVAVNGVLTRFDYIIILFILTLECADEDNFIWLALIFGFFADFARDGFYGPGVALFMVFYMLRFRSDVMMDMTKMHYRLLMFSSMSFIYCMFSLYMTDYMFAPALTIAFYRTLVNVGIIFLINSFFKGYCIAVKNA
jgi:hypothetical protein